MTIQIDTREHRGEVERIEAQLDALGVNHFRSKLYCGDYQSLDNGRLVIDRKKDLLELCGNVTQQHKRFRDELVRARETGIQIIVLCEHGGNIVSLMDVYFWENPRRLKMKWIMEEGRPRQVPAYPDAVDGPQLYRILCTIGQKYGVRFEFCRPEHTGKKIVRLLGGGRGGG